MCPKKRVGNSRWAKISKRGGRVGRKRIGGAPHTAESIISGAKSHEDLTITSKYQ
jgi:hypothetical protein